MRNDKHFFVYKEKLQFSILKTLDVTFKKIFDRAPKRLGFVHSCRVFAKTELEL